MEWLVVLVLIAAASAANIPQGGVEPITVYGVEDKEAEAHLDTFRKNYVAELVKTLHIDASVADDFVHNIGFDEYRQRLDVLSVGELMTKPVIVLHRSVDVDVPITVYVMKGGVEMLPGRAQTQPVFDALLSGENTAVAFYPSMLPAEGLLRGMKLNKDVIVASEDLTLPSFARVSLDFAEIPWLLIQPKSFLEEWRSGLKEIGMLEVTPEHVGVISEMGVVTPEMRTMGTMRASFLNWSAFNITLPTIRDILSVPSNLLQALANLFRPAPAKVQPPPAPVHPVEVAPVPHPPLPPPVPVNPIIPFPNPPVVPPVAPVAPVAP